MVINEYTWKTADIAWDEALMTWNGSRITDTAVDGISMSDRASDAYAKVSNEPIGISGTYIDNILYFLRFIESVVASDCEAKSIDKIDEVSVSTSDMTKNGINKSLHCAVSINDKMMKCMDYLRKILSNISVKSTNHFNGNIVSRDDIALTDTERSNASLVISQAIGLSDDERGERGFHRILNESIAFAEILAKNNSMSFSDAVNVVGDMLHHSKAIISDIVISTNDISMTSPVGFGEFTPFLPGDFLYSKALFKIAMDTTKTNNRPVIEAWKLNVDLPDITDRGTEKLSASKTKIMFNRSFYQVPEVTITMKSASGIVPTPVIVDVTRTYFDIELRDSSGTIVSGDVSWQAIGC